MSRSSHPDKIKPSLFEPPCNPKLRSRIVAQLIHKGCASATSIIAHAQFLERTIEANPSFSLASYRLDDSNPNNVPMMMG